MSTQLSATFFEKARQIVPGGVHSPVRAFRGVGGVPRFVKSASGAEFEDVDGNLYVDYCMSWGPLLFGHRDPEVHEAVQEALNRGWSYGTAEPYSLELAELITQQIPWVQKIRFVNSGTEAVMAALRVARAATGRNKILKFSGCYHGHTDSMLVKAGSGLADMSSPDSAGVAAAVAADTLVVPLNDLEQLNAVFEVYGKEIAAVIYEGIPANNGLLLQEDRFLPEMARIARLHGSLLILDEVITGFRVAFGGMAEVMQVRPDLVTYGKIIGGGFPVGAYGGRADLMDWVAPEGPVYQAGTLSANPVAMVAGKTMLLKLKKENPYAELARKTEDLCVQLEKLSEGAPISIRAQRFSSLFWMVLDQPQGSQGMVRAPENIPAVHKEKYAKVFHSLLDQGVYLAPSAFEVSFLSTAHKAAHRDKLVDAVRNSLAKSL